MTFTQRLVIFCSLVASVVAPCRAVAPTESEPWLLERNVETFQALFSRSPFSLPTIEESSSLSDRYMLTGAMVVDGEPLVFIFDRTTQVRQMISKAPNAQGIVLIDYLPDPNSQIFRATIRAGSEIGTIAFSQPAQDSTQTPVPQAAVAPQVAPVPTMSNSAPPQQSPSPQRRVIRRAIISGQPPAP